MLVLNGSAMVAEGPIASVTFTPTGKRTYTPTSGHTDNSMSVEHWYSDLGQSELFLGLKPTKIAIGLPATGLATVDVDMVGQDVADTTAKRGSVALTSQYFTSPTAANGAGLAAAVNGAVCIGGVPVATITGATLDIASNYTGDAVVGSNIKPFQFAGRVLVTGQITAYFDSVTLRDAFWAETEVEIVMAFSSDNTATSEFMAFAVSRVKTGGAARTTAKRPSCRPSHSRRWSACPAVAPARPTTRPLWRCRTPWPPDPPARPGRLTSTDRPRFATFAGGGRGRHGHNHHPRKPWTPPSPHRSIST